MSVFRDGLFENRFALVTGAGSGICRSIAVSLARAGADVILVGRTPEKLNDTAQMIATQGRRGLVFPCDVRHGEALAKVAEESRGIDMVVAGAAGNFRASASALSPNGFRAVMEIDAGGTFNTAKAAFPHLRTPGGAIVNISAVQALLPGANQIHVNAAKAAVDMITRSLAIEWGPLGIRVNSIAPGPVADTEGMDRLAPGEALDAMRERIPLRRLATRQEIADLVLMLFSDLCLNVTGAVLVADGAMSLVGYDIPTPSAAPDNR
jgi:NAD(P)-dependent dehydrogenase (short-subunit alcohol dehydrogenase family)